MDATDNSSGITKTDICVIGAGPAGLSVAAGAAQMGARTVLIEVDRMGGDCLNTGCVPSKSLLAAAQAVHAAQAARRFAPGVLTPAVDLTKVHAYVHDVINTIAPHDSIERFTGLGCTVIKARARFLDERTIEAGSNRIRARRFVIATGSRAALPPIPGLAGVPYFTNETLFDNTLLPGHLLIIGAGPIGCEMAQAYHRLGSRVTVLDLGPLLPKDDPEAAAVVRQAFLTEGIAIAEGVRILRLERRERGLALVLSTDEGERAIEGSNLLVAAGRRPNVDDLGLDKARVRYSAKGIEVDARLRTSNKRIFAAGDVVGSYQFTHLASHHAGIVLRNALFRLPARINIRALPWVTFTDPELAQVGLTEAQAHQAHGSGIRVLRADFSGNDRAHTHGTTEGFLKVVVSTRGHVLGATIVGPHAGELIQSWVLAISRNLKIGALANMIAPYPTFGEINKQVAGSFYTPTLFSRRTKALVRFLGMFG